MPSVVRLSFYCIRMIARIFVRYIHNGRGHKALFANISRVCFYVCGCKGTAFF